MCTGDDEDLNLGLTSGFTYNLRDKYDLQITGYSIGE